MKKILLLVVVLIAISAGLTFYSASRAETQFRQAIEQTNQRLASLLEPLELAAPPQLVLNSYDQHFLDADARISLKSDDPQAHYPDLLVHLTHGPIIWRPGMPAGQSAFALLTARPALDTRQLSPELQEKLTTSFSGEPPLQGLLTLGFDNIAHYQLRMNPLNYQDTVNQFVLELNGMDISGTAQQLLNTDQAFVTGNMTLQTGALALDIAQGTPDAGRLDIPKIDMTATTAVDAFGQLQQQDSTLQLPQISITAPNLPEPVSLGMQIKSGTQIKDGNLQGDYQLSATDLETPLMPVSQLQWNSHVSGLPLAALQKTQIILEDIQKLSAETRQIQTRLLAAYSQSSEQQPAPASAPSAAEQADLDRLATLSTQTGEQGKVLLNLLFSDLLQADKTAVKSHLAAENELGKTALDIDLTYSGKIEGVTSLDAATLQNLPPEQLLQLLRGKLDFTFDKNLYPLAALFLEHPAVAKDGDTYRVQLELAGKQLVLNGQSMSVAEFLNLLVPTDESGLFPADPQPGQSAEGDKTTGETAVEAAAPDNETTPAETIDTVPAN